RDGRYDELFHRHHHVAPFSRSEEDASDAARVSRFGEPGGVKEEIMAKAEGDLVQRYFDDELAADERARFEAAMTDDDRERLVALGEMRALLNGALEAEAADVDLWAGVQAGL